MSTPIFKLAPGVQSYDWGKIGRASLAAQYAEKCVEGFQADEQKPYAELWMGTHPTLPSYASPSETLAQRLASDPSAHLGEAVLERYPSAKDGQLPFLFKVLSIGKALSIQAHPDKELAERLHRERGDVYKDPNHKPEMAIALTPFRGFCGFLPLPLLLLLLSTVPEIRSLIGEEPLRALAQSIELDLPAPGASQDDAALAPLVKAATSASSSSATSSDGFATSSTQKTALKRIFEVLMSSSDADVRSTLRALLARYDVEKAPTATSFEAALVPLVKELNGQYPDDVGVLCCFVLNVVELGVGEAVFLKADEPHAYISGDIIECMATSDNVVRAGLTPKLRDVPTLISMLTYTSAPSHAQLLRPTSFTDSGATQLYDPPIDEFSVLRMELAGGADETHRAIDGPSIVIVTEGSGRAAAAAQGADEVQLARGEVAFVAAGSEAKWTAGSDGLVVFRAFLEV